ncbi:Crp/Fnr family transcriptional regulator [Methylobacterium sp. Leaf100]|uniref:Crp/Fnr family transcriptional regulator n=1 Tax=Methylobacterium sp. Leaf100 TaxID=1736252 RepID=UPI0009E85220|nr:Crp/Fnr family transcriptional regulator [Methylobacterium sp. Leaf100]
MPPHLDQTGLQNRLLANLRPDLFEALAPHLTSVSLDQHHVVETSLETISHVCFPGPGIISIVARTPGDIGMETGLVGPEGMTGLPLLYGVEQAPYDAFVQIPCRVLRIPASDFQEALATNRILHLHLLRYAYAFSIQVAQTALCNGRFPIEQRLARWLLMSHDRLGREDITLTHEFLSLILGVRRAGVTMALHGLVARGAVAIHRGMIVIRDRALLLGTAAGAYGLPESVYADVMPGVSEARAA